MTFAKGSALNGTFCEIEPGSSNYHLRLAFCDDCNLNELLTKSLEAVDDMYRQGYVRQPMFEAYMYVWATSATRSASYDPWTVEPTDAEVVELIARFRKAVAARKAVAR